MRNFDKTNSDERDEYPVHERFENGFGGPRGGKRLIMLHCAWRMRNGKIHASFEHGVGYMDMGFEKWFLRQLKQDSEDTDK
jgi:hypothetical protein